MDEILRLTRDLSPGSPRDAWKLPEPDLRLPKIEEEIMKIAAKNSYLAKDTLGELRDRELVTYAQWSNLRDKIENANK